MRLLRHNLAEKVLAVLLTLFVFYTVEKAQVPEKEMAFSKRLVYENVPKGMKVVEGHTELIRLTVKGEPAALAAITRSDLDQVYVSVRLDGAQRGTASYPVFLSLPPDLHDKLDWQVSPRKVDVTLVAETDVTVPVVPFPSKGSRKDVAKDWIAEPETVIVSGNERDVARVAEARIVFDPNDPETAGELREIQLVSRGGRIVEGDLTVSPSKGRVLPASTEFRTKRVSVSPRWEGHLPVGYRMSAFRVIPGQTLVRGSGAALVKLDALFTEPISLWGLTTSRTVRVPISAPVGVTLVEGTAVDVRIEIEAAEESR